jgi:hypothetical protein
MTDTTNSRITGLSFWHMAEKWNSGRGKDMYGQGLE